MSADGPPEAPRTTATTEPEPENGRRTGVRAAFGTAILLASVAALLLPPPADAGALAALAALWWLARPQPGRWPVGLGLSAVATLLLAAFYLAHRRDPPLAEIVPELQVAYARLWDDLAAEAASAAARFAGDPQPGEPRQEAFRQLQEILASGQHAPGTTLLLLDPDGDAAAWAGVGLIHEGDPYGLPRSGLTWHHGYTAATLLALAPLSETRRPWRLMAGRSLATDRLPFSSTGTGTGAGASAGRLRPGEVTWFLRPAAAPAPPGTIALRHQGAPTMFVEPPRETASRWQKTARRTRRTALIVLGFTLFAWPILRAADRWRQQENRPAERAPRAESPLADFPLLTMAGFAAWALAAGLAPPVAAALVAAAGLAIWSLLLPRRPSVRRAGGEVRGALAILALTAGAWLFQRRFGAVDLAAELGGSAAVYALRLTGCLLALALLRLSGRRRGPTGGDGSAWLALLLLLAAAAGHDLPVAGLAILALGAAATVRWLTGVDFGERPAAICGLLLLAALAGGAGWEIAYREAFRDELASELLPKLTPPTAEELNDFLVELYDHFEGLELPPGASPAAGADGSGGDLAYVLWRRSPLAHRDGLSALVVEPFRSRSGSRAGGGGGQPSSFSFGLSLAEDLELALSPARWQVPQVPEWRQAMISGEATLEADGRPWGRVEYWFQPRPGFRLEVSEISELDAALVRGEPLSEGIDGLLPAVLYGLYSTAGRAIVSPWEEAPPLAPAVLAAAAAENPGRTRTPAGPAWYWKAEGADGVEVLYLPQLSPLAALERVGTHAFGSVGLVALVAALALGFALPRKTLRDLVERTVRSYSKRLLLVYTVLLLLPLIALNLFLLKDYENRLGREQMEHARGAIGSARLFLLDYLLRLEPGSSIETRLNRPLLEWVASVVEHQVSLYWGSRLYASSQEELFTAGLLTERIPGEIYSRLAFDGQELAFRKRRAGEVGYLEFYAPLPIPGTAPSQRGFFLSVPLLEQEEVVARDLANLRRRAVLVTTALFFLLTAVGSRLARSFTTPIMELIEGTRRIAAGAPFLTVAPREQELSSLADAVDQMARRIAEGRKRLVLEKQVVERIVANITSAVVSLDRRRRVLLHNRVAAELLGTEVGEEIGEALRADERLSGVAAFLGRAAREPQPRQETLKLLDEAGESREWALIWVPLPGSEDPAALLVVDDVTEVVRGQRLEAWAEMARIIAHEIKNPLTPIRLSAEHMRQVYATDREDFEPVLERCTDNILDHVEELRNIASDFSIYSRIPRAELRPGDLVAAMRELAAAYGDGGGKGASIELICDLEELEARFDKTLLGRAMRNLLENALRANAGRGRVELGLERSADQALIRVADSGPGVEPGMLQRIFEPYFSTYESGTGLGLAITRRIVEEHGGRIVARNRPQGGLEVLTTLPLSPAPAEIPSGAGGENGGPDDPL